MAPNQTETATATSQVRQPPRTLKFQPSSTANLFMEEERLKTFRNWPCTVMSAMELAANGFYYVGVNDIARCAFCGLEVGEWQAFDSASEDHRRFSPSCDMVRGRPCGNIALSDSSSPPSSPSSFSSSSTSSSPTGYDVCGPFGYVVRPFSGPEQNCSLPGSLLENLEKLGVSKISKPAHAHYSTEDARLRSFVKWPETCPVKPAELAAAGFFSTGEADCVVCFQCGGGLKDWEENDDPWVEHARWFARCTFVLMHKGPEYVTSVQAGKPPVLPAETLNELLKERREECESSGACADAESSKKHEAVPTAETAATATTTSTTTETAEPSAALRKPEIPSACTSDESHESSAKEMELCKICYSRPRGIVFLPCGHFVSCAMCAAALSKCPVCRKPFEATVRAFLS